MGKIILEIRPTTFGKYSDFERWIYDNWIYCLQKLQEDFNKQNQKQMTKSKTSSKSKKVQKVKIETTPSGSYRVRKSKNGVVINRTFSKKKDAVTFRDAFYA